MINENVIAELNRFFVEFISHGQSYIGAIGKGDKNLPPSQLNSIKVARELVTVKIPKALSKIFDPDLYQCDGSVGQGRIANTPWIAVKNKKLFERKDERVKAYIVFFLSSDINHVYISLALRASDFKATGKKQTVSIDNFSKKAASLIAVSSNEFISHAELDIKNETYKLCSIYPAKWDLDNYGQNIGLIQVLTEAYDKYNEIQSSDSPIMPDYQFTVPSVITPDTISRNEGGTNEMPQNSMCPIQKIYFGTPGGGKSKKVKNFIELERHAKDRCFRTTFHPDTDYASFVGSYKPVMKGELICYRYVPQIFTIAYCAAWNDPANEYFLDIEEINRGNCAQIFGDLFQLLDRNENGYSEFPILADTDLADFLLNGKNKEGNDVLTNKAGIENNRLCLPPNLSILATMNTSDQSLFPMDSAFKRRWDWEYVPSAFRPEHNFNIVLGNKSYKWHEFLKAANARIKEATDSEDKQMGTYFVKADMNEDQFKSKVMYYLWSEICKEEYHTDNNFFRYKDKGKKLQEFSFNELYEDGSTDKLQRFMNYILNSDETEELEEQSEVVDAEQSE